MSGQLGESSSDVQKLEASHSPQQESGTQNASESSTSKPELPWAFIECPSDTLVVLIAHMLNLLCQHNDQVILTPDALTRFHSRAPPGINVIEYLRRIVKYTNLEKIPLLSLLAYIDLTCQNLPTFTLSSLTVHRFLIAGVTAGSKAQCDVFCTNSHYAKVGGIKVGELNSLEREFLRVTGWALCCNADLLQRYYTSLIRSHGGYTQAPEPKHSPFLAFPRSVSKPGSPRPASDLGSPMAESDGEADEEDKEMDMTGESKIDSSIVGTGENSAVSDRSSTNSTSPDMKAGMIIDSPRERRGRERRRVSNPMEIDSSSNEQESCLPGSIEAQSTNQSNRDLQSSATTSTAPGESSNSAQGSRSLKSLVGGIFRKRINGDDQDDIETNVQVPERADPTPHVQGIIRSRPLSDEASIASATQMGPTASSTTSTAEPPDMSPSHQYQSLTPRVRTRDERSVESLRTGVGTTFIPPAASGDDGKRRARVEL